jgi:hypothetical protein
MSTAPTARVVAPSEGTCVMLFAVRFDYKVTSADSGGALAALRPHHPERLDPGAGADLRGQALTAAAGSMPSDSARNRPV